jgi:ABC-type transporter MlaC component
VTRGRFEKAFRHLAVCTIGNATLKFVGASFEIMASRNQAKGRTALVRTTAQPRSGSSVRMDSRVHQPDSTRAILGFTEDGLSLLFSFGLDFRKFRKDNNIDELVETMRSRSTFDS